MYPPVPSSTSHGRTQNLPNFNGTKTVIFSNTSRGRGNRGRGAHTGNRYSEGSERNRRPGSRQNSWTPTHGSSGSTGGSSSPSLSSPVSRTSSVGSHNGERPGSAIARQASAIVQNSPALLSRPLPQGLPQASPILSPPSRPTKGNVKPFNHLEIIQHMNRACQEAKKAIAEGHGVYYDAKSNGQPVADFKPFDWEEFWQKRKMKGI